MTPLERLTPRQREAITLIATGITAESAAVEMGCSVQTVKRQLGLAYERLDVSGRVEAFVALGWLRPQS